MKKWIGPEDKVNRGISNSGTGVWNFHTTGNPVNKEVVQKRGNNIQVEKNTPPGNGRTDGFLLRVFKNKVPPGVDTSASFKEEVLVHTGVGILYTTGNPDMRIPEKDRTANIAISVQVIDYKKIIGYLFKNIVPRII